MDIYTLFVLLAVCAISPFAIIGLLLSAFLLLVVIMTAIGFIVSPFVKDEHE